MADKHILARAIAALQLASECGGDLDIPEYKASLAGLLSIRDRIVAYNDSLNRREVAPTGDDYNELLTLLWFPAGAMREAAVASTPYKIGQRFDFEVGQPVICNGFEGAIAEVHSGQLQGMVSVRLDSGSVTVSASYPDCYPAPEDRTHLLKPWIVLYGVEALEFHCMAEDIAHATATGANPVIKCWDDPFYNGDGPHTNDEFTIQITDQRIANGQMFVDFVRLGNEEDDQLSISLEANRLPESDAVTQCMHLHFDSNNMAMSVFRAGDEGYLLRTENGIVIEPTTIPSGESVYKLSRDPHTRVQREG